MLTREQQVTILADIAASNGLPPGTDPDGLDPAQFDPGELCMAIELVKLGKSLRDDILPLLSPETAALLAKHDPDSPPHKFSTWADLVAALGPIRWEWAQWLPAGMLTMLVAEQAAGKSILALRIAACYLRGDPWPDGTPFEGDTGAVLWCEAESSQGMNGDRAVKWGLPVDRIYSPLGDPFDDILLQDDAHMDAIRYMAARADVRLVVVDSLSGANVAKENDARMVHTVKSLATIAKQVGKPVILTHHFRKLGLRDDTGRPSLDRIRGSGAIVQPARVVWAIDAPDPQQEDHRRLSTIKNNLLGLVTDPLGMRIDGAGVTFDDAPEPPRVETQQDKAADVLAALLHKGPRKASELQEELEDVGISWRTAHRAKDALGVVAYKKDVWWWALGAHQDQEETPGW